MNTITSVTAALRQVSVDDNTAVALVIRKVSVKYGLTVNKGYTVAGPSLDELFQIYSQPGATYWVVEQNGEVMGNGGVAPLGYSEPDICELQKIYFLSSTRGQGLTKESVLMALEHARGQGFKQYYLEITAFLAEATHLCEHLSFEHISEVLGCIGHVDCEVQMLRPF